MTPDRERIEAYLAEVDPGPHPKPCEDCGGWHLKWDAAKAALVAILRSGLALADEWRAWAGQDGDRGSVLLRNAADELERRLAGALPACARVVE